MSKTSAVSKNKWISSNYVQIKVAIKPDIAKAFKDVCKADNVSITEELRGFMEMRGGLTNNKNKPKKELLKTRSGRRKSMNILCRQLELIKEAELFYCNNIPTNLQGSANYEIAEESISDMEEAIEIISRVY